jgi:hypothetical protein
VRRKKRGGEDEQDGRRERGSQAAALTGVRHRVAERLKLFGPGRVEQRGKAFVSTRGRREERKERNAPLFRILVLVAVIDERDVVRRTRRS